MPYQKGERERFCVRVSPGTSSRLNELAKNMGFVYGDGGATGEMMDAIAQGKLLLIPCEDVGKLVVSLEKQGYNKKYQEESPDTEP